MVEYLALNEGVGGSSPSTPIMAFKQECLKDFLSRPTYGLGLGELSRSTYEATAAMEYFRKKLIESLGIPRTWISAGVAQR